MRILRALDEKPRMGVATARSLSFDDLMDDEDFHSFSTSSALGFAPLVFAHPSRSNPAMISSRRPDIVILGDGEDMGANVAVLDVAGTLYALPPATLAELRYRLTVIRFLAALLPEGGDDADVVDALAYYVDTDPTIAEFLIDQKSAVADICTWWLHGGFAKWFVRRFVKIRLVAFAP